MTTRTLNWMAGFILFCSGAWMAHVKAVEAKAPLPALSPIYDHPFLFYSLLVALAGAVKGVALTKGAFTAKAHVQKLLDGLVAEVMKTPSTFGAQDYRVTLFKYKTYCWTAMYRDARKFKMPRLGWLVPYARSGGEPLSGKTFFEAPKTSRQGQQAGHGVAGTAWILGEAHANGLPAITSTSGPPSRKRYCRLTFITEVELAARVRSGKSLARSLWAVRVATSKKPKWGVLVYDTVDHQPIIDSSNEPAHRLGLQALALVLEENAA